MAGGARSTVGGGAFGIATGLSSVISGGENNQASGSYSTVAGGERNSAPGIGSTVAGGAFNTASGRLSFAAGTRANTYDGTTAVAHDGAFVWADSTNLNFYSTAPNEFAVRATGGVRFVTALDAAGNGIPTRTLRINPNGELDFGSTTRQMLRLWGGELYGIGVQADTLYQRSASNFAWYQGGTHSDTVFAAGFSGTALMTLTNGSPAGLPAVSGVARAQTFTSTSDRAAKEAFELVDGTKVLAALVKMPLQSWKHRNEDKVRHIGPTAQDFRAAFGMGYDDKTIATVDADGVAMAAIQGLHAKLHELLAAKDEVIQKQATRMESLERDLYNIKALLGVK